MGHETQAVLASICERNVSSDLNRTYLTHGTTRTGTEGTSCQSPERQGPPTCNGAINQIMFDVSARDAPAGTRKLPHTGVRQIYTEWGSGRRRGSPMVVVLVVVVCVCIWMSYWGGVTGFRRVALLEQERIAPGDIDLFLSMQRTARS